MINSEGGKPELRHVFEGSHNMEHANIFANGRGHIMYQMSLDGSTFESQRNMTLSIPAKVGSPISATPSTDTTGVVYVGQCLFVSNLVLAQWFGEANADEIFSWYCSILPHQTRSQCLE